MTSIEKLDQKIGNLKLQKQAEDLANNNKIESKKPDDYLFDSSVFKDINQELFLEKYKKFELVHDIDTNQYYFDLGDNLIMRPMKRDDYSRDYLGLLAQLTKVGDISQVQFEKRFEQMQVCNASNTYFTFVIVDLNKNKIAGSITHVYEQKFFRNTGARGRIEDVVVHEDYRGKKLSKILLDVATQLSKNLGCYKLSLECFDDLKKLYMQFGFQLEDKQNYLCRRF